MAFIMTMQLCLTLVLVIGTYREVTQTGSVERELFPLVLAAVIWFSGFVLWILEKHYWVFFQPLRWPRFSDFDVSRFRLHSLLALMLKLASLALVGWAWPYAEFRSEQIWLLTSLASLTVSSRSVATTTEIWRALHGYRFTSKAEVVGLARRLRVCREYPPSGSSILGFEDRSVSCAVKDPARVRVRS